MSRKGRTPTVLAHRSVFSVGQVAKLCCVSPRTVSKWFDSGLLKGYVIPGSRDRRIPRGNLINFLNEHNVPLGFLHTKSVVLVNLHPFFEERLIQIFSRWDELGLICGLRCQSVSTLLDLGVLLGKSDTNVAVIDFSIGRSDALLAAVRIQELTSDSALTFGLAEEDETQMDFEAFVRVWKKPCDTTAVCDELTDLMISHFTPKDGRPSFQYVGRSRRKDDSQIAG